MAPLSNITIQVFGEFEGQASTNRLQRVAEAALSEGRSDDQAGLSVLIADDEVVRGLNRQHRGLDENTDVLSFSFKHNGQYYGHEPPPDLAEDNSFVLPPGQAEPLGDVIISFPQAQRQASESGHSTEHELSLLLAHGILHLLGHDHKDPEEALAMNRVSERALALGGPKAASELRHE
jgi:probable rRNA maturation factor